MGLEVLVWKWFFYQWSVMQNRTLFLAARSHVWYFALLDCPKKTESQRLWVYPFEACEFWESFGKFNSGLKIQYEITLLNEAKSSSMVSMCLKCWKNPAQPPICGCRSHSLLLSAFAVDNLHVWSCFRLFLNEFACDSWSPGGWLSLYGGDQMARSKDTCRWTTCDIFTWIPLEKLNHMFYVCHCIFTHF